ncbi:MAG: acyl-CoA thioesterase [Chlamydiae bacterium]|nr:acyl-CoA thioesterase [Chlamydiota bacterium]
MVILKEGNKKIKSVAESAIEHHRLELSLETLSPDGIIYGSKILELVSSVASLVADNHSELTCKTLGIDFIRYFSAFKIGDILICKSSVNRVWENAMEVGLKVVAEDFRLLEEKRILSAYFTFVALDDAENHLELPLVMPHTRVQKRRYLEAEKRRSLRLKRSHL